MYVGRRIAAGLCALELIIVAVVLRVRRIAESVSMSAGAVGSMGVSGGEVDPLSGAVPSSSVTPTSPGPRGGNRTSRLMRTWLDLTGFYMRYILLLLLYSRNRPSIARGRSLLPEGQATSGICT